MLRAFSPCVGEWIEIQARYEHRLNASFSPCVGEWIEIQARYEHRLNASFSPCVGEWIEIIPARLWSRPKLFLILCR